MIHWHCFQDWSLEKRWISLRLLSEIQMFPRWKLEIWTSLHCLGIPVCRLSSDFTSSNLCLISPQQRFEPDESCWCHRFHGLKNDCVETRDTGDTGGLTCCSAVPWDCWAGWSSSGLIKSRSGGGGDVSSDPTTHSPALFPFSFPSSLHEEQLAHMSLHCSFTATWLQFHCCFTAASWLSHCDSEDTFARGTQFRLHPVWWLNTCEHTWLGLQSHGRIEI